MGSEIFLVSLWSATWKGALFALFVYVISTYFKIGKVAKTEGVEHSADKHVQAPILTDRDHELQLENLEDWAYEQVGKEFDSNNHDKGAWTKAFAQANGDEKQTKVLYIKARVDRLISEQRKRLGNEIKQKDAPLFSDAELMDKFGITFDGERYQYGEYRYDKLADALNYAKHHHSQDTA